MHEVDLLIIGAGPGGIAVAGEAHAAGMAAGNIALVEKSQDHSASIRTLYPASKAVTANYKGLDALCEGRHCLLDCSKDDLLEYLDDVIDHAGVRVGYGEQVYQADSTADEQHIVVRTSRGEYRARAVVVAVGVFGRPNRPDYKLPRSLKDRIHYDVTSSPIEGEDVLVVGGGDSAAEYSMHLTGAGNRVTLSYRRADFSRMQPGNRAAVLDAENSGLLDVWRQSCIGRVEDDGGRPAVQCTSGPVTSQRFDRIVYALGGTTPTAFLRSLGVRSYDNIDTNVAGVYLAGDLAAGMRGGSIISAFNSAHHIVSRIESSGRI